MWPSKEFLNERMYLEIKSVKDGIKEREHIKNLLYLIILVIKIMKYLYFTFLNL